MRRKHQILIFALCAIVVFLANPFSLEPSLQTTTDVAPRANIELVRNTRAPRANIELVRNTRAPRANIELVRNTRPSPYQRRVAQSLVAAGYNEDHITFFGQTVVKLADKTVLNDMFLTPHVKNDTSTVLGAIQTRVEELDEFIIAYFKMKGLALGMPKRGTGATGRGWGITSPFSNKYRYYTDWLAKLNKDAVRLCEVGFLAGHSAAVLTSAVKSVKSLVEFDFVQPGTNFHAPATGYFKKVLGSKFHIQTSTSCRGIAHARTKGALRHCDFISLDGSKAVGDVICDLFHFNNVSTPGETVILTDDVQPSKIQARTTLGADELKDHHHVLEYLVRVGALTLEDCWESDVEGWPAYGVCAFKYTETFREFGDDLFRRYRPKKFDLFIGYAPGVSATPDDTE